MAFYTVKKNKLWIWKAYSRTTGELIDWESGNRDTKTFERLYNRIKQFNVKMFYSDTWDSYAELINPDQLLQTKAETWGIIGLVDSDEKLASCQDV